MRRLALLAISILVITGCTMRGVDTTLTPQLLSDGQVVYVYSDLANFAQPDQDPEAEKLRLRDLDEWIVDIKLCPNGYEIIKRQAVPVRAWSQGRKVYYFIRCKG